MRLKDCLAIACALLPLIAGCKDEGTAVKSTPTDTGTANFAQYVALGNSLTAGFQSNALSERDEVYAYPYQIAGQIDLPEPGTGHALQKSFARPDFQQPAFKDPGIGSRIRLVDLKPTFVIETGVDPTSPFSNLNVYLPRPYNNLGIPGALLYDMMDTTGASSNFVAKSIARLNPFFAQILRSHLYGNSIVAQAKALHPTFVTVWIGNNDVLGYATSGGTSGSNVGLTDPPRTKPTESSLFDIWYRALIDTLRSTGAGIVVGNIPDIATIPFFTTLGPQIHAELPAGVYFRYQRNGNTGPSDPVADTTTLGGASTDPLITLAGSDYASLIGRPTGQWYRDRGYASLPPGIDTTKPFGLHPQNPWPDALTLDAGELAVAEAAIQAFDASIDSIASNRAIGVMDAHALLTKVATEGIYVPELGTFSSQFIVGGAFSYDGVHPSSRGQALIANEWIRIINRRFSANIPLVSVPSVPGIPIGKAAPGSRIYPDYGGYSWRDFLDLMD
jgi:lysophospholipase L1-like esterase